MILLLLLLLLFCVVLLCVCTFSLFFSLSVFSSLRFAFQQHRSSCANLMQNNTRSVRSFWVVFAFFFLCARVHYIYICVCMKCVYVVCGMCVVVFFFFFHFISPLCDPKRGAPKSLSLTDRNHRFIQVRDTPEQHPALQIPSTIYLDAQVMASWSQIYRAHPEVCRVYRAHPFFFSSSVFIHCYFD